jgi:hypothetical protein
MAELSAAAKHVLAFVRDFKAASFTEIGTQLREFGIDPAGEFTLLYPGEPSIVLWTGVSEEFIAVLDELLGAKLVHYAPASPWVYLIDGGLLDLPLARRLPRDGYRKPHWLPIVVQPGIWPGRGRRTGLARGEPGRRPSRRLPR